MRFNGRDYWTLDEFRDAVDDKIEHREDMHRRYRERNVSEAVRRARAGMENMRGAARIISNGLHSRFRSPLSFHYYMETTGGRINPREAYFAVSACDDREVRSQHAELTLASAVEAESHTQLAMAVLGLLPMLAGVVHTDQPLQTHRTTTPGRIVPRVNYQCTDPQSIDF